MGRGAAGGGRELRVALNVDGDGFEDAQITFNAVFFSHGGYVVDRVRHALYLGGAGGLSLSAALTVDGGSYGEAELVGERRERRCHDRRAPRRPARGQVSVRQQEESPDRPERDRASQQALGDRDGLAAPAEDQARAGDIGGA